MTLHGSLAPGTLLGGKFRIEHLIGAGAMGAVYAIDHELTRHKRALKLLHPEVQHVPDLVRRFLNEASAAGRAGNPHLVETFDAGTLPTGEPYVVMELLCGETLSARLEREQRLEPSLAAELVAQAAEGMEAAHRAGIIHRDLKPDNLFITEREGRPFIKILDFGVSKFATASAAGVSATQAGAVYGTPSYMAPEQIGSSVELDARADVFALGVVLFECLSGTLPFEAPSIPALALKLLQGESASLAALCPELPPPLVAVVTRALASDRDRRIASARARGGTRSVSQRPLPRSSGVARLRSDACVDARRTARALSRFARPALSAAARTRRGALECPLSICGSLASHEPTSWCGSDCGPKFCTRFCTGRSGRRDAERCSFPIGSEPSLRGAPCREAGRNCFRPARGVRRALFHGEGAA